MHCSVVKVFEGEHFLFCVTIPTQYLLPGRPSALVPVGHVVNCLLAPFGLGMK
jgi:hypothetical protein